MRPGITAFLLAFLLTCGVAPQVMSEEPVTEIEHLLRAIGQSKCIFVRNGKSHSAAEAEDQLRLKYNRTKSRIKTAEAFIDRLASDSSWTGEPYTMRCADDEPEPSKQWLYRELGDTATHDGMNFM